MNRSILSTIPKLLCPAVCNRRWSGYDLQGADFMNFEASSEEVCDDSCQNCEECNAWTMYNGKCYLKTIDFDTQIIAKGSGYVSWVNCS